MNKWFCWDQNVLVKNIVCEICVFFFKRNVHDYLKYFYICVLKQDIDFAHRRQNHLTTVQCINMYNQK